METHRLMWLLLAALSVAVAQDEPSYFLVDQELILDPSVPVPITSILWKYNTNLLAEWVKDKVDLVYYGVFKNRTTLDTGTGRLEIRPMTAKDVGVYTVEINNKIQDRRYAAKVIVKVPQPVAFVRPVACTKALENCTLICGGDEATEEAAQPVTYSWREDDNSWVVSKKDRPIVRAVDTKVKSFSCKMKNPVSEAESKPLENPFFVEGSGGSELWALVILVVPICILVYLIYRFRDAIWKWINSLFSRPNSDSPAARGAELNPPKDSNGTPAENERLQPASEQP